MSTLPFDNLLPESTPVVAPPPTVMPGAQERVLPTTAVARVLHLVNGEHYAGAERVQDLLAQCLPQCGFEIAFACVKPKDFAALLQSQNTPVYNLPMRNRLDLGVAGKIAEIVRREKYALIHCHTVRTAMIGSIAARLAEVPMVYHVHSPMSRNTGRPWLNWINNITERLSLRRASRLITVSKSLKEHMIRQGFDASRITVVPNGVPTLYEIPFRRPPRGDCPDFRVNENGTVPISAHAQWTLGTAALFRPRKGIEVLLRALAMMRKQKLPVRLLAVGEFESLKYEREIHALAASLGLQDIIQWTGFTSDVTSELLAMDLFVLPSLYGEGMPMVLLEAMAAGVPAVAADVEGVAEAIRHGQDGLIVTAGDHQAIAQAVTDVIEGRYDWSAMRDSALKRQAQFFSHRSMADGVAEVYRQVLE
jgi:glycosyltransferase involved in cell wall biosynthesis